MGWFFNHQLGVSQNRGKTPKMDGENTGKPYEQMDDLGENPLCSETPNYSSKRFSAFDPSQEAESFGVQLDVRGA